MPCKHYLEGGCRKSATVRPSFYLGFLSLPAYKACPYGDVIWANGLAFARRPEDCRPLQECPDFNEESV